MWTMKVGDNLTDKNKLGIKRHILIYKNGITLSDVILSANAHDIKLVTGVLDNVVIKRSILLTEKTSERKRKLKHVYILIKRTILNK